jgi:NADPH:quinone reductase-like Zn-dependent oxidoreductase
MHGAVLHNTGDIPQYGEFVEPAGDLPGVVVEVRAAGLNPSDRGWAQGLIEPDLPLPRIVGNEGVGVLDGQRVYFERSKPPFGSFGDKAVTAAEDVIALDDAIDDFAALTIGIAGLAPWVSMETAARLQPGESVLVLGASGPVGRMAVHAGRLMGASRVVAAARHRPSLDALVASGVADAAVQLGTDHDMQAIADSAGGGYDVIMDLLYGPYLVAALDAATFKGRVVTIGRNFAHEATIPQNSLLGKQIISYTNFWYPSSVKRDAYRRMMRHVIAGDINIPYRVAPMTDVAAVWAESMTTSPHQKLIFTP